PRLHPVNRHTHRTNEVLLHAFHRRPCVPSDHARADGSSNGRHHGRSRHRSGNYRHYGSTLHHSDSRQQPHQPPPRRPAPPASTWRNPRMTVIRTLTPQGFTLGEPVKEPE